MTKEEIVKLILDNLSKPLYLDSKLEQWQEKLQSMVLLIFLKNPDLILGTDRENNDCIYNNYNIKYSQLLMNSEPLVYLIEAFNKEIIENFPVYKLEKLAAILNNISNNEKKSQSIKAQADSLTDKVEEKLVDLEKMLIEKISDQPLWYFENKPNTFFQHIDEMSTEAYYECIFNNGFTDVIDNMLDSNFDFSLEQTIIIQNMLVTSIDHYEDYFSSLEINNDLEIEGELNKLLQYKSEYDIIGFNIDSCVVTHGKIMQKYEEGKRKEYFK